MNHPHPADVALGQRLRAVRQQRGLSQQQVAAALGVTHQMVQKYETGRGRVAFSTLVALAGALDVDVALLADGTGPRLPHDPLAVRAAVCFVAIPSLGVRRALVDLMKQLAEEAR